MSRFYRLLLFLCLLGALPATAQQLVIRDFELRPQDMDAQSNTYERMDRNGKRTALLKIYTSLPASELTFDGSALSFYGVEQHAPGQVWLWVPRASQKVVISHPKYNPLPYQYPTEIQEGRVYSFVLTPEGKEVSLSASARNAQIWLDGDSIGTSPVTTYIPYGTHAVRAKLGSLVFDKDVTISRGDQQNVIFLPMEDENLQYGDVVVNVEGGAELWFEGQRVGIGEYIGHLRGDHYVIEARKANHEPTTTTFMVTPGRTVHVHANPPVPHKGYLQLTTIPEHGVTVMQGDSVLTLQDQMQLPVANYEWTFSRRGYTPVTRRFRIHRSETLVDTVTLRKIQYVPRTTGYVSVAFTTGQTQGISFTLGGMYQGFDLSVSYMLGLGQSDPVSWYNESDNILNQTVSYRVDELAVHLGYVVPIAERFGVTPQIGIMQQRLMASGEPGNGFTSNNFSIGARLSWHPIPHLGVFATPEYAIPIGAKGDIVNVCQLAGITRGGFRASIGLMVNL